MRSLAMATDRSRWIPYGFVAFFGVVLLANARTLDEAAAQAALGWEVDLELAQKGERTLALELVLEGRHGDLIEDALVSAAFVRPTHEGHDRVVPIPHRYGGEDAAEVALPLAGQWELHLTIEAGGEVWREPRRVYLRP
ncbi:MAG: integral rane protein linked to a cation pump [Geminicoccaceae bacterium]|nr:integral rane protein linked to a cation pump [Geminicoccaceae bacterium]